MCEHSVLGLMVVHWESGKRYVQASVTLETEDHSLELLQKLDNFSDVAGESTCAI